MIIVRWLINTLALAGVAWLLDGIEIKGVASALIAAGVIGLLNVFIRPVLLILTLPLNIFTLGLFTLVINALMIRLASALAPGFYVAGFWSALFGALLLSIFSSLLGQFFGADQTRPSSFRFTYFRSGGHHRPGPGGQDREFDRQDHSPRLDGDDDLVDLTRDKDGKWK